MTHRFISCLAALGVALLLSAGAVSADTIAISPSNPVLTGSPGDTVQFIVDLTNTVNAIEFLNSLSTSGLTGFDQSPSPFDTSPFFTDPSVPISLGPTGQPDSFAPGAHLFDVIIPADATAGLYGGGFTLFGGEDGGAGTATDTLAQQSFTVEVTGTSSVPEPDSAALLIVCLGFAVWSQVWPRRRISGGRKSM